MLRITHRGNLLCDRIPRRELLTAAAFGLSLPSLLEARADASGETAALPGFGRAKRCVLLFLTGGPPQHDTWDMKPDAPAEIRGEFKPITTSVPGIQVCELFPLLAREMHHVRVLRTVTHTDTVHTSAGYTMLTGVDHPLANAQTASDIKPKSNDHPHLGAILSRARPPRRGIPTFVSMPEIIRDDVVNEYPGQDGGFMGRQYSPFLVEADSRTGAFLRPEIYLPAGLTSRRLETRRALRERVDRGVRAIESNGQFSELDSFYHRALDLVGSPAARAAFDLDAETPKTRERYGTHLFGQGCLLARRLLEAGVSLVTVYWHYEGPKDCPVWDTHCHNFSYLRDRLVPPTDQALSAMLSDLAARGMLDDTLFVCMGEFGRTPKINGQAGRDHWPHAQSILLAGAGIPPGSVYGATDPHGAYPAENPVSPRDLTATFLHLLGVRPDLEIVDRTNRPFKACEGSPVGGLIS